MSEMLVVAVILLIALTLFLKYLQSRQPAASLTYSKQQNFLSPAERSFFGVLKLAIGDDLELFSKVRVADVITPQKGMNKSNWQGAFNKISAKHFDFVLCNKDDLSVACAIELDDKSHNSAKTKDRDLFLNEACDSANLPLVRFRVKSSYTTEAIQEALKDYLLTTKKVIETVEQKTQACPLCQSELVKRVAKKGKNAGNEFMACSGYPKCKYIQDIAPQIMTQD